MKFSVLVEVSLRPGIADPQGATIERALPALGFNQVAGVRTGKAIRFTIESDGEPEARAQVDRLCRTFLTNPVIEDATVTLEPAPRAGTGMTTLVGVVQFPGSNCEHDVIEAVRSLGADASLIWHGDTGLGAVDAVVLPGGFAHGDYLRPGAIARFSPVMAAIEAFAASGGPVVGICNGFQVLAEAHLLPGALQKNRGLTFLCMPVDLEVTSARSVLTRGLAPGRHLRIPINHFEGNYTCDAATLAELQAEDRIVLRYVDNPNGSVDAIAGVCNAAGNVVGLMPHPERAIDDLLGSQDGRDLLCSLLDVCRERVGPGAPAPA